MLSNILKYEFKLIHRSGWILSMLLIMIVVFGFAARNGFKKISQRSDDISKAKMALKESDEKMLDNIEKLENGEEVDLAYWLLPTKPSVVGMRHPRLTSMEAAPLAILSTGQSDMFSHYSQISTYGSGLSLNISEMVNPMLLLFGTFDLAFVFMFVIPLFIIAYTFNILSRESELGTLKIIGAQPVQVSKWLISKLAVRCLFFILISTVLLLLYLGVFARESFSSPSLIFMMLLQVWAYQIFWFVLSGVVNLKVNNSSKNALILIGLWLLFVLVIPVTTNLLGNVLYPSPSRLNMINEMRTANKDIEKKQDETLACYLRDHPELASTESKDFNFWHKYFASQDLLNEKLDPLVEEHQNSLKNRQAVVSYMKFLSPSLLFYESVTKLAETSTQDYLNYQEQAMQFKEVWRGHVIPLIFHDKKYTKDKYLEIPIFEYERCNHKPILWKNLLISGLFTLLLVLFYLRSKFKFNPEN